MSRRDELGVFQEALSISTQIVLGGFEFSVEWPFYIRAICKKKLALGKEFCYLLLSNLM
jgi:hypothetical protein